MEILDDGKYSWKDVFEELDKYFCFNVKISEDYDLIYRDTKMFKDFIYDTIHNRLFKNRVLKENEDDIRYLVKYVIAKMLPYINSKIRYMNMQLSKMADEKLAKQLNDFLDLEDDLYALASFRSLMHYAHYMERQDDLSQLVWKYNMEDAMGGIFYYSNSMILNQDSNVKALIKQCPTGYGKCVDENTYVTTNYGRIKIKDVKIGDFIYSMKNGKCVEKTVVNKWNTMKSQVKIKTRSGKEIIVSPEHKMFTTNGYKMASELTTNDYFYSMLTKIDGEYPLNSDEITFIAGMIFEGSCTHNTLAFSQEDNEFKDYFLKACQRLGIEYGIVKKSNNKAQDYWFKRGNGVVIGLLKKYNIYECNSKTKRIDRKIFELPLQQKYDFISIMFATDGYIPKYNGIDLMGITLANEELIDDLQYLLSTCGIYSKKAYKKSKCNGKHFDAWRLEIPDEYAKTLYENCYFFHKQSNMEERMANIFSKKVNVYCNRTNYPKELLENCKEFKRENNKQWARNKSFKKEIVEEFNNRTHLLDDIIYRDFYYDQIVKIEYCDEKIPMVDIEVDDTHNFVANGFVSHNSKSDCVIITFCFGFDINDDIMKIVGNRTLVKPITQNIISMMKSKRFRKVFPEYDKYDKPEDMFETCSLVDGTFKLRGSKKSLSFACFNKETAIDGGRFNKQFYDDITQSDDRENVVAHLKDRGRYESQWKKRQYDEFSCKRWFTGTAYHREDFLSYIRKYNADNKPLEYDTSVKRFKWSKFVQLNHRHDTVYVSVPKLADLELGEDKCYCTFPQKYSKVEALKELHSSITARRRFMAMEQQEPLPPESLAFDWAYLNQYEYLPQEIKEGLCDTIAIIDPNRKAKDNYSCLIFKKPISEEKYYFVDCYYKKTSPKVSLPKVAEKIAYHKVDRIAFENNTADDYLMKQELKTQLSAYSYSEYKIESFFSTMNKEDKISKYRDDIREKIVFPQRGMYYEDSDMGRALSDIVNYSLEGKNGNDDSIDCCAMLIIKTETKTKNSIQTLNISL